MSYMTMSMENLAEFECGCCFELLVEPTTLGCGHTFCRLCIARWTVASEKRVCPTCKVEWRGTPKVNIGMRNIMEMALRPEIRTQRLQEVNNAGCSEVVSTFETMTVNETARDMQAGGIHININFQTRGQQLMSAFPWILLVLCFLVYLWNRDQREMVTTPVEKWTTDEVLLWLGDLGPWTDDYSDKIRKNGIDGKMLLMVQDSDAIDLLGMTNGLHRRVILGEISTLASTRKKQPVNLWEYKSVYPYYVLFLLFGFYYPRMTIAYIYLFEYDAIFSPFMNYAYPDFPETEMAGYISYYRLAYTLMTPYWLIGQYIYKSAWCSTHYYLSRYIMLACVANSVQEMMWIWSVCTKTTPKGFIKEKLLLLLGEMILFAVSTVLPWFVHTYLFYEHALSLVSRGCVDTYKLWRGYVKPGIMSSP